MDTCVCVTQFLHCSLETITTLLISYTLIQNKKLYKIQNKKLFKKLVWKNIKSIQVFFSGGGLRANDIHCEQKLDTKNCETFESSALGLYELYVR